ncbi:uncharacterized protein N7496_008626 [Penicillium cataractarum]|uniref:DUF3824 domain-containing protein n=1 Tax=Penicillium cataractarum TaxID=2100454 RepID=A0A9W9RYS9_9EURO|nr:uncharacterized protein N7496_008626 [Penicillium cataractarum]KAJ5368866.1 hypothetical protein N7496_008626 [Penicillium cataractarum]
MSYSYRERDRYEEDRPVTVKRYVISADEREERRDFMMGRDDAFGDRELVIRRKTDREEPLTISRYERDVEYDPPARRFEREYERDYYERECPEPHGSHHHHHPRRSQEKPLALPVPPPGPLVVREQQVMIMNPARNSYTSPRESEYDVVRRSDAEEDPYYYHHHRRVREYDDRRSRRELSPGDSISQTSRRHHRDRDRDDYSSDDSMVYIRKETRDYDGEHHHHKRHLAEGALVGVGAAELLRSHSKREGKEVSHGMSHAVKTAGAGALGAVAVNAAGHVRDYYRSKSRSRHRSHSFDDHRSHRSRRSRSRSHSHSRGKTLLEIGIGAAALAAGAAALRSKSKNERRSRSRTRSRSRARALSSTRSEKDSTTEETKRRQHMAGAGLAGAAVAGLVEHARSRSRSRKGERSHSRLRKALPIVGAGLATAAATGLYEKKKAEKDQKELVPREGRRSRSRSRSRAPSEAYPDPTRDSAGLIEYGADPVAGSIPAEHYYGQPAGHDAYYSDGARRHSRSRSRGGRYSGSSDSDRDGRRKSKKHRSRSRELASAALGATGLGYAAHKYSQHRDRKKAERSRSRSRTRYEDDAHRDPYEESYDPEPYPISPQAAHQQPTENYYPNSNYFPPPPGPETYAPRPRRADENVSAPSSSTTTLPTKQTHAHDGAFTATPSGAVPKDPRLTVPTPGLTIDPNAQHQQSIPRLENQSSSPLKSVAFDLNSSPDSKRPQDPGYETDDSDSTIDEYTPGHRPKSYMKPHSRARSSSLPSDRHDHHSHTRDGADASSSSSASASRNEHHHSHHSQRSHPPESSDSSESTIDLPDRFDSKGRLLSTRENPSVESLGSYIRNLRRVFV